MQSKYKVVVGSLVGAVAIHAAFVACGGSLKQGGDGSGGSDGGLFDAVLDVISDAVGGETRDAVAAVDAGNGNDGGTLGSDGGACGCTVSLSGPVQSTPASENSAQLRTGSVHGLYSSGSILFAGPFVLTDAMSDNNSSGAILEIEPAGNNCSAWPDVNGPGYLLTISNTINVHGGRFLVPAGQMLCAYDPAQTTTGGIQWAGFVPYE